MKRGENERDFQWSICIHAKEEEEEEEEDATTIEIPSVVLETFDSRNKRHVRHMPGKL